MSPRRRNSGFGLVEFLAVTLAVALGICIVLACCSHHQGPAGGSNVTTLAPQQAAASGTVTLQGQVAPTGGATPALTL